MRFHTARVAPEKTDCSASPAAMVIAESMGAKGMDFKDQYKHPSWQKKRLEVLEEAEFRCEICSDEETTLHVHHKQYIRGRKIWEYDITNFVALCECCHEQTHRTKSEIDGLIASMPIEFFSDVADLLSGFRMEYLDEENRVVEVSNGSLEVAGRIAECIWWLFPHKDLERFFDALQEYKKGNGDFNFHLPKRNKPKFLNDF